MVKIRKATGYITEGDQDDVCMYTADRVSSSTMRENPEKRKKMGTEV